MFDISSDIAGVCGEIVAMKGVVNMISLGLMVVFQGFGYKVSDILNSPFESVFKYITVLPDAFSAYRYITLQNSHNENSPLAFCFLDEA